MNRCAYDPDCERVGVCQAQLRGKPDECRVEPVEVPYVPRYRREPPRPLDEPFEPYGLD